MAAGTIPIKTPQGQAELGARQRRVGQRHRTVLFLVDGKRSMAEVRRMALEAGVPETGFDELVEMGMIVLPEAAFSQPPESPVTAPPDVLHVDLPLPDGASRAVDALPVPDSILPPSRTLYPSISTDSTLGRLASPESWLPPDDATGLHDPAFAEARAILLRAVRAEAPLAGSLTLLRLRRARGRADLRALLDEAEARITRPHRSLAAGQTMRRVRQLLDGRVDSSLASA